MRLIILLGAAAVALPFVISFIATAKRVGTAVSDRFLERSTTIPPEPAAHPLPINQDNLHAWVTSPDTARYARAYARCVVPLDFLYLLVLGSFLALGAYTLASLVVWPPALAGLPRWVWLFFPAAYTIADFAEDCLIIALMTRPARISNFTVGMLTLLRNAKIGANALAIIQIFGLGLASAIWR